jgi:F-box/leucine-rich repeat protein 14
VSPRWLNCECWIWRQVHVTDAGLGYVSALTNLRTLVLCLSKGVTDTGLKYVSALHELQHLNLLQVPVTDVGMSHISRLANLEELDVSHCNREVATLTDMGVSYLGALPQLKQLNLTFYSKLTAACTSTISTLGNLQRLNMSGCGVLVDGGLGWLSDLPCPTDLNLSETRMGQVCEIFKRGVVQLSALVTLQRPELHGTDLTDADLPYLSRLTELTELGMGRGIFRGRGLLHISSLVNLRKIRLPGRHMLDDISPLVSLVNLRELDLSRCHTLSDAVLAPITTFSSLQKLQLTDCFTLTDAGLLHVAACAQLNSLKLSLSEEMAESASSLFPGVSMQLTEGGGLWDDEYNVLFTEIGISRLSVLALQEMSKNCC